MRNHLVVSHVRLTAAPDDAQERGLLGWISLVLNDTIKLDGVTLRRTAGGRLALSFPARRDAGGRQHQYVRPLDDRARREIESQVFQALGLEEVAR